MFYIFLWILFVMRLEKQMSGMNLQMSMSVKVNGIMTENRFKH